MESAGHHSPEGQERFQQVAARLPGLRLWGVVLITKSGKVGKAGDSIRALILFRNYEGWCLCVLCEFIFLELNHNCRILRRANRLLFHAPKACCLEPFVFLQKERPLLRISLCRWSKKERKDRMLACALSQPCFSVIRKPWTLGPADRSWLILISNCSGRFALIGSSLEIASEMGVLLKREGERQLEEEGTWGKGKSGDGKDL
ncbi:hypothetical protein QBC45DRAFT_412082 [Copromyces sp. CBS 386.78]|nr:hypothetical protein QBC45DRAFT_412082 [Copromyces sp. CBS 386.78]